MSSFVKVYTPASNDKALNDAELLCMRQEGSDFLEVEESDLSRALELLPGDSKVFSRQLVVHEGIVVIDTGNRTIGSTVKRMWDEIATDCQVVIRLNNQGGGHSPHKYSEGEYHINLYSVPEDPFKEVGVPSSSYLTTLTFQDNTKLTRGEDHDLVTFEKEPLRVGFERASLSFEFLESTEGDIFAAYTPFNAYITIKCGRDEDLNFSEEARTVLKTQFLRLFEGMAALVPDLPSFMEDQEKQQRREQLISWGSLVAGRHDERVKATEKALDEANSNLVVKRRETTEILREIPSLQAVIRIARDVRPDTAALAAEFDSIYESPWVERIEIDKEGESMTVFTHLLLMDGDEDIRSAHESILETWAGRMVPMGKYSISMTASGEINITNITNRKERSGAFWHHPHIPASQSPCFGSIERTLPQLLAKYEFAGTTHLLIQFLSCCNADDPWGRNIYLWEEDAYPKASPRGTTSEAVDSIEVEE